MQQTSHDAFESIKKSCTNKQFLVYKALLTKDKTNEEISKMLGWPINCVTPRTKELFDKNIIESKGKKLGTSGRRAIVWGIREKEKMPFLNDIFRKITMFL